MALDEPRDSHRFAFDGFAGGAGSLAAGSITNARDVAEEQAMKQLPTTYMADLL